MDEKQVREKVGHALRDLAAQQSADEATINAVVSTSKRFTSQSAARGVKRTSSLTCASIASASTTSGASSTVSAPAVLSSSSTAIATTPNAADAAQAAAVGQVAESIIKEQQQQDESLGNLLHSFMESMSDDDETCYDQSLDPLPINWSIGGPTNTNSNESNNDSNNNQGFL